MLSYASDAGHAPARYDYGLALTERRRDEDKIMQGLYLIAMTCRDGDIGAIAWCGRAALYGCWKRRWAMSARVERLERPALEDHPMALTLLSLMYRDGLGVDCNTRRAFELTLRAAEAGYGKVNLGIDVATLEIGAIEVTDNVTSDAPMLPCLLDQIPVDGAVTSVSISGDSAYDTASRHEAIAQRGPQVISPTRKDAKP
jgi:TPR repeat protein